MKQKGLIVIIVILLVTLLASCVFPSQVDDLRESNNEEYYFQQYLQSHEATEDISTTPDTTDTADTAATTPVAVQTGDIPHGYIAMEHILFMNDNLYGRTPFSYRELEAAQWISSELLAMGYAQEDIVVQEFSWEEVHEWAWDPWEVVVDVRDFFREFPAREGRLSQNVILTVPGQSEQVILVVAHYDGFHYAGAADNASGVALLLESAQRLLYQDNYYTIVYIFFGGEEVGLLGSYFYLESLTNEQRDNILFVVNADVLFEGPYLIYAAGYDRYEVPGDNAVSQGINVIAYELSELYDMDFIVFPEGIFWLSDHSPFLEVGHTAVVFAGLTEVRENLFNPELIHTPRDCIHYINEAWPGMAERAMRAYSIFLERILLARY